ncbi:hypothetical protein A3F08_01300 [Candidatus Berkelbacteria bacterium RIFCSPHIGHO2_12_FULL_36_9]|uniref:Uncharacterized protein n=1 Tax=Candidatus Berkelbacteria bacterium RIFCSPHIGHO2_12_FULL_36_9 TaxID=1797469 RepID=A0A1F5EFS5_9BACT|nr:MAG: hypothetical protein A3F08_01300 [Candidatus Berkelbacteria bacterium RIFCSPHIGHO2_12_FULL_36_9]
MKRKYLISDIIRLINEFLAEEIDFKDVKKWLKYHPCLKKDLCSKEEKLILVKLQILTQKPVNENEWKEFQDELKTDL